MNSVAENEHCSSEDSGPERTGQYKWHVINKIWLANGRGRGIRHEPNRDRVNEAGILVNHRSHEAS